jgi:hypothetical protein
VPDLIDMQLRALRRDRAARTGPELFLLNRAFEDCVERISLVRHRFERALLIGCPDPAWPTQLGDFADRVDVRDPGLLFAERAGGEQLVEDACEPEPAAYDLVLSVGTLDTVNDLQRVLLAVRWSMQPQGLFLGALSGGDTLPRLRSAMRAADAVAGGATPHVHPRIEASALAPLLAQVGFINPVVDVDRVAVAYRSFAQLVADLRRMAATNILTQRSPRPLSKSARASAAESFMAGAEDGRVTETFEILHFACWSPPE